MHPRPADRGPVALSRADLLELATCGLGQRQRQHSSEQGVAAARDEHQESDSPGYRPPEAALASAAPLSMIAETAPYASDHAFSSFGLQSGPATSASASSKVRPTIG